MKKLDRVSILLILLISFIVSVTVFSIYTIIHGKNVYKEITEDISNGYIVYVNGIPVDSDKIVVDKYPVYYYTIDDNNKLILITTE